MKLERAHPFQSCRALVGTGRSRQAWDFPISLRPWATRPRVIAPLSDCRDECAAEFPDFHSGCNGPGVMEVGRRARHWFSLVRCALSAWKYPSIRCTAGSMAFICFYCSALDTILRDSVDLRLQNLAIWRHSHSRMLPLIKTP